MSLHTFRTESANDHVRKVLDEGSAGLRLDGERNSIHGSLEPDKGLLPVSTHDFRARILHSYGHRPLPRIVERDVRRGIDRPVTRGAAGHAEKKQAKAAKAVKKEIPVKSLVS